MTKMTKKNKKQILNKILGIKKFAFCWTEQNSCYLEIEAKDEQEAREIWNNGEYDSKKINKTYDGDGEQESLEIEEIA